MILRSVLAIFLFLLLAPNSIAGDFIRTDEGLTYSGIVSPADLEKFDAALDGTEDRTPIIVSVALGDLKTALELGIRISEGEHSTRTGLSTCTGLCGLIWLAGNGRSLAPETRLNFSSAGLPDDDPATQIRLVNYLTRIGLELETVIAISAEWDGAGVADHSALATDQAGEVAAADPGPEPQVQPAEDPEPAIFHPQYTAYTGDMKDGVPHGAGEMTTPHGDIYRGAFRYGRPHGDMVIEMAEGDRFTGRFSNGKLNGPGVIETADGQSFDGHWENGIRTQLRPRLTPAADPQKIDRRLFAQPDAPTGTGTATLPLADGARYSGATVNGKPHGAGTLLFPDGTRFHGWFVDGLRNGPGVLLTADGSATSGTWENDVAKNAGDDPKTETAAADTDGGEHIKADPVTIGRAIAGLERDEIGALQERLNALYYDAGTVDGQAGRRTMAALRAFAQDFELLERGRVPADLIARIHGTGNASKPDWQETDKTGCKVWLPVLRAQSALRWTGKCIGGHVDGPGNLAVDHVLNGKQVTYIFVGETDRGHLTGYGTEHWGEGHPANQERYTGQFVDGLRQGRGKFFYADGSTYSGEWKAGLREGEGEYSSPKIGRIVGTFSQDKPNGYGEHYDSSGNLHVAGDFRNGCLQSNGKTVYVFTTRRACGF